MLLCPHNRLYKILANYNAGQKENRHIYTASQKHLWHDAVKNQPNKAIKYYPVYSYSQHSEFEGH